MKRPKSSLNAHMGDPAVRARRCESPVSDDPEGVAPETPEARLVRLVYGRERSRWESLKAGEAVAYQYPRGYAGTAAVTNDDGQVLQKARKSEWQKLYEWMREHKLKPSPFVACAFDHIMPTERRAPEPPQLRCDEYLTLWRKAKGRIEERILQALESQRGVAKRYFHMYNGGDTTPEDAWAIVLLSGSLELSPLFRYCVATSIGGKRFRRISARYHAEAVLQFERYRKFYLAHWSGILPTGFAEDSARAYPHLLAR